MPSWAPRCPPAPGTPGASRHGDLRPARCHLGGLDRVRVRALPCPHPRCHPCCPPSPCRQGRPGPVTAPGLGGVASPARQPGRGRPAARRLPGPGRPIPGRWSRPSENRAGRARPGPAAPAGGEKRAAKWRRGRSGAERGAGGPRRGGSGGGGPRGPGGAGAGAGAAARCLPRRR